MVMGTNELRPANTPPNGIVKAAQNGSPLKRKREAGTGTGPSGSSSSSNANSPARTDMQNGIKRFSGEKMQPVDSRILEARKALPIWAGRDAIVQAVRDNDTVIILGETGSGKTTQIPQFLHEAGFTRSKQVIGITQPRRVAATSLARRVATEMGEPDPASAAVRGVGAANADEAGRGKGGIGAVGYSIRFDDRTGPRTRIKFLTDGMVLREMLGSDSAVAAGRLGVGAEDGDTGRQDKGKGKAKVDGINGHAEQGSAEEEGAVSKEPAVTAPANGKAKRNSGLGLLSRYSVLVIDEAHERTLRTDMVLGCVKRIQAMRKKKRAAWIARGSPDGETVTELKVVVMSATLDASAFSTFFDGAPVLYVRGRQHGVATYHTPQPCLDWSDAALRAVLQIHVSRAPGDMLVFMTGQEEIESLARSLAHYAPQLSSLQRPEGASAPLELLVTPIYAALGPAAGARVFAPTPPRTRKVVLATNIAETSITIPGIKYVVDCGLAKEKAFTPSTGVETLAVRPISQSAAAQRAGRAGREGPGECYRLYTEAAHDDLEKAPTPEIIRTDLAAATLQLVALGRDPWHFDWMDAPDAEALQHACIGLVQLGAVTLTCEKDDKIEEEGADSDEENKDITGPMPPIRITALGKRMANLPLDPAYARILLAASDVSPVVARQARDLVALLSADRGVFVEPHDANKRDDATRAKAAFAHPSGDHATLLKVLAAFRAADASARATARGAAISAAGANGNANGKRAHSDAQAARAELKAWCETHFVHERAMRNVLSIRTQLARLCVQAGIVCDDASDFAPRSRDPSSALPASDPVSDDEAEIESEGESSARAGLWVSRNGNRAQRDEEQDKEEDYVELRRCFLEGRFTHLALRQPDGTYKRLQTSQPFKLHPTSTLHGRKAEVILFEELAFTTQTFARTVSKIEPSWIVDVQSKVNRRVGIQGP